jgi:hypothetical protein
VKEKKNLKTKDQHGDTKGSKRHKEKKIRRKTNVAGESIRSGTEE